MILKPQHQDSVIAQFLALSTQIRHNANTEHYYSQMQVWEAKEYKAILASNQAELTELKELMMDNESVFNTILSEYSLSVATFTAKYSA